jgi:hypothetical protein
MRISDNILELVMALRDAIQQDGGQQSSIAQELSKLPDFEGSTATAGYRVTPEGDITDDHWWLIMDDGSVFDASDDEPSRCSKKDSRHGHYFPYTGETGIPAEVLQMADHLRASSRVANNKSFIDMVGESEVAGRTEFEQASVNLAGQNIPFPEAPKESSNAITKWMSENDVISNTENLSKITSIQNVPLNKLHKLEKVFRGSPSGIGPRGQLPLVVRFENNLYLYDGNNRAGLASIEGDQLLKARFLDIDTLDAELDEASGAAPSSGVARQAPEALPDAMTMGGQEGVTIDAFDDETKPEDLQMGWEDLVDEDEGDIKEVDHPEYMPGGESGTSDYDPTYDERSVHTNAGHPRP